MTVSVLLPKFRGPPTKRPRKIYRVIGLLLHDVRSPLKLWVDREHDRIEARLIIAVADMIGGGAGLRQKDERSDYRTPSARNATCRDRDLRKVWSQLRRS